MDASQEQTDVKAWVVLNPSGAREAADPLVS
jgi:hypothetical protein